jgi:hypothetical protein
MDDVRRFILTYPDDSTPYLGTASEIAKTHDILGQLGEPFPHVFYVTGQGEIREATVKATASPYDEDEWSTVTVNVLAADGTVLGTGSYRVDGRS